MSLVCITNDMPNVQACTDRDAHLVSCDGWAYKLVTTEKRKTTVVEHVATGKPCKGCVPREARVGMLCTVCWSRLEHALADWPQFANIIEGIERAVKPDGGGGGSAGYVPIPGTRLSVEECNSYLSNMAWNDARAWVNTTHGARNAVLFTRAAETAYRTHPIEEKAHKIQRVRCQKCSQLSLVWNPVNHFRGPVRVTCQTEGCGAELDQTSFEKVAEIEEQRSKRGKTA